MTQRGFKLLVVLLLLVQFGLAVGHCHDVECGSPNHGTRHVHVDRWLDWGTRDADDDHDSTSHDEWTIRDAGPMSVEAASTEPGPESTFSFSLIESSSAIPANLLGSRLVHPPPDVGSSCPRFLTFCTLRN